MIQYRLKENVPDIEIVDGPFAGRTFEAGKIYTEVPPAETARFDTIEPSARSDEGSVEKDKGGEE